MTKATVFEDFSSDAESPHVTTKVVQADPQQLRGSFDEGYKCGWQDASDAADDQDRDVREALSSALQALNFTYFEARQHIMQSVRPILEAMTDAVLPELLARSLGGRVVEILNDLADATMPPITVACAPECEAMLRELVTETVKFPIEVKVEPTLSPAQAVLQLKGGEVRIDLDATIEAVRECIDTFFETSKARGPVHA
ncbi:hypothetical protein [Litoreibacter arenae]|uniref:ABC transporter, ATP-binding protein, flagellar, putative n=1 Tax=Litoreibacter arenae DSM 19593 TaxID=1123360 RepID=S9Q7F7_9RHOB|nr:hypothetical protein [Litoreibacter arenae]EPX77321.1 ABC transporter, ATP-binding protein, flagellar, putative [Litoreibacter arenae DSM 19593]